MWVGSMTLEYVKYIMWALEQSKNIHLLFVHSGRHLNFLVKLYSWDYSQKSLFILIFFTNTICSSMFIENIGTIHTGTIHNIVTTHTNMIHYLYRR